MRYLCVYCGSNPGNSPAFATAAIDLGRALAAEGFGLVYGGGRVGLMGTIADAALAAGAEVIGVIPRQLADREVAHEGLSDLVVVETMHERKAAMADRSVGFIALPGGYGTLDEVLEILTWNQIGAIAKPVVFLDVERYFESLFRFFDEAVDAGLVMPAHRVMAQRVDGVRDAVSVAGGAPPPSPSKWTDPSVR